MDARPDPPALAALSSGADTCGRLTGRASTLQPGEDRWALGRSGKPDAPVRRGAGVVALAPDVRCAPAAHQRRAGAPDRTGAGARPGPAAVRRGRVGALSLASRSGSRLLASRAAERHADRICARAQPPGPRCPAGVPAGATGRPTALLRDRRPSDRDRSAAPRRGAPSIPADRAEAARPGTNRRDPGKGRRLMLVAIHQPQFLPWLGYLDKIDRADLFVVLDCVQFKKNEWQN